MQISICGVPHEVIECADSFDFDSHFGLIDYKACTIKINKDMSDAAKEEALCHEILHGILVHLGYNQLSQDEQFVQALSNAIYQTFMIRGKTDDPA